MVFWKKTFFPIKKKQGVNNWFKPLISSVFTTVASTLKLEQKEKEKEILKLNSLLHYNTQYSVANTL